MLGLLALILILDYWLKSIDIHFISAMSAEPERVFSDTKHTNLDQRNILKSEIIELLKYLKSSFRLGIFTEEDLHAIVGNLAEDEAIEALKPMD